MNIFDRIAMLFRSNVNAVISEFEQPEKMLNQIILDMRSQLVKAKQQVAAAIADEKRLQDQTKQELKEAEDWERRAMLAVQQNQDELAKQALMRRTEHISRCLLYTSPRNQRSRRLRAWRRRSRATSAR